LLAISDRKEIDVTAARAIYFTHELFHVVQQGQTRATN